MKKDSRLSGVNPFFERKIIDMHFGYALTNLLIAAQQSVHSPSAGCAVLSAGAGEGSSAFSPL